MNLSARSAETATGRERKSHAAGVFDKTAAAGFVWGLGEPQPAKLTHLWCGGEDSDRVKRYRYPLLAAVIGNLLSYPVFRANPPLCGLLRWVLYADLDNNGQEQMVTLTQDRMRKLLKWMVHSLEIFMWEQDYCHTSHFDDLDSDCFWGDNEYAGEAPDFELECFVNSISLPVEPTDEIPTWSVHAEYSNHTVQDTTCYDGNVSDRVDELYWKLLDYFEPAEDDFDKDFND